MRASFPIAAHAGTSIDSWLPMIGTIVNVVEGAETGLDVPEGWFELGE